MDDLLAAEMVAVMVDSMDACSAAHSAARWAYVMDDAMVGRWVDLLVASSVVWTVER